MHILFSAFPNYLFIISFTEPEIKRTKYYDCIWSESLIMLLTKMLDLDSTSSLLHMLNQNQMGKSCIVSPFPSPSSFKVF